MDDDLATSATVPERSSGRRLPSIAEREPRYRRGDEIARSPTERIVEATDLVLHRPVVIVEALDTGDEARRRFAREVAITAGLEHPSIVAVYDSGVTDDGAPYYVMRKVPGEPLSRAIERTSARERLALVPCVLAAAQAVAHAHGRGVVHGKLGPANILVGELGDVVVIDWRTEAGDPEDDVRALAATLRLLAGDPRTAPRELAAITAAPYPDAAAFAEDVQRFLTGQLVASHRYTRRERLWRFLRRHRAAVAIAGLALAVLVVGGILALRRVLDEIDRTDEQAQRATGFADEADFALLREQDHVDRLALAHAQTLATTAPAAAIAELRQLAAGPRWDRVWREARAIAAEARRAGIAFTLPGPPSPGPVVLDGDIAVVAGAGGAMVIFDLARRTQRTIDGPPGRRIALAGKRLVTYDRAALSIIDLRDGARRDFAGEVVQVAAAHDAVYWLDASARLWRDGTPVRIDLAPAEIRLSPDGAWLLARDAQGIARVDLAKLTFTRVAPAGATAMAWNAAGTAFAVTYPDRIGWFGARETSYPMAAAEAVAALAHGPVALDRAGVLRSVHAGQPVVMAARTGARLHVTLGNRPVLQQADRLSIFDELREVTVPWPAGDVLASPSSRFLVGAAAGRLVVLDVEQLFPAPRAIAGVTAIDAIVGARDLIVRDEGDVAWLDLATGERRPILGLPPVPLAFEVPRDVADRAAAREPNGRGYVIRKRAPNAVPIEGANVLAFGAAGRLFAGTVDGAIVEHDPPRVLSAPAADPVVAIAANRDWVIAGRQSGTAVRVRLATAGVDVHRAGAPIAAVAVAPDGAAYLAAGPIVHRWSPEGAVAAHATLPDAITALDAIDAGVVAVTANRAAYLVGVTTVASRIPEGTHAISLAGNGLALVTSLASNEIVDLAVGRSWPLTTRAAQPTLLGPSLSNDRIAGAFGRSGMVWDLAIPATAAATAAWLDELCAHSCHSVTAAEPRIENSNSP